MHNPRRKRGGKGREPQPSKARAGAAAPRTWPGTGRSARGLGRGLDVLFSPLRPAPSPDSAAPHGGPGTARAAPDGEAPRPAGGDGGAAAPPEVAEQVVLLEVENIRPSAHQPRQRLDERQLSELAGSIASVGVLEPVLVREIPGGYELIAGERRWRAVQRLRWPRIPAIVRNVAGSEAVLRTLVENVQRADLSAIEEAGAFRILVDEMGLTQEQVADRVGKDRTTVANTLRLLKLPQGVQALVVDGRLSAGHARAVLAIDGGEAQADFAQRAVDEGWTVRQAEAEAALSHGRRAGDRRSGGRVAARGVPPRDAQHDEREREMRQALGTRVRIRPRTAEAGVVEVDYYTPGDLERVVRRLSSR